MTAFVTRTSSHYGTDRILTSVTARALYENLLAFAEKDATAVSAGAVLANGYVTQAILANSAVGQAQLKSATASGSVNLGISSAGSYALTGGTYSWWTASAALNAVLWGNSDTAAGTLGLHNTDGVNANNFYVDERYIQASPPYDLGHGSIAQFIYALVAGDGSLRGVSVGADPTWAYHGPTDIRPKFMRTIDEKLRELTVRKTLAGVPFMQAIKDPQTLKAFLDCKLEDVDEEVEITTELKNADMDICPHPWFQGNDLSGLTVTLLDPTSRLVDRLAIIAEQGGAQEVRKIIEAGYLNIDNRPLDVTAPRGVMPVAASWKA